MIHGGDDGAAGFTIEDALNTNLFAETHDVDLLEFGHETLGEAPSATKQEGRG